jgi:tellurite resistance protein
MVVLRVRIGRSRLMNVTAPRVPLNFFSIPFGLAGLGGTWLALADDGGMSRSVANGLFVVSAAVWLVVLGGYLGHLLSEWPAFRRDLLDADASPFGSLALITPMILAAEGLYRYAPGAGRVLLDVFLALTVVLGAWFTGQWIYGRVPIERFHPGYFLPLVAGGLIGSAAAAEVGQHTLAEVMFGLGVVCWIVYGSMIMGRLILGPPLPEPLVPTLAIEVAPAAVASLAYFAIDGGRVDQFAAIIAGYGLVMALAQLRLLPLYARLHFSVGTWAFTFSWAAVATTALHWLNATRPGGYRIWEYVVVAAITALVGAIAGRTMLAIGRGQFLPVAARRGTRHAPA